MNRHLIAPALVAAAFTFFLVPFLCSGLQNEAVAADKWTSAKRVNDDLDSNRQRDPDIAIDDRGNLSAVWEDDRDGTSIYYARSTDGGDTWSKNVRITDNGFDPDIEVDAQGNLYVLWHRIEQPAANIYCSRSTTGGASWETPVRVGSASKSQADPSLAADRTPGAEGRLIAAWTQHEGGVWVGDSQHFNDIFAAASVDGGRTWFNVTRVTWDKTPQQKDSHYPVLEIKGSQVYALWRAMANETGIYRASAYLPNGPGSSFDWTGSSRISSTWDSNDSFAGPDLAFDEAGVSYKAYAGFRYGPFYALIVADGEGDTQQADDQPSSLDLGYSNPTVAAQGNGNVFVAWNDLRSGHAAVYFSESGDQGRTWSNPNRMMSGAGNVAEDPALVVDSFGTLYMVWEEEITGGSDVMFARRGPPANAPRTQVDITLNGSDGPITVAKGDELTIRVSVATNQSGLAEYWLVAIYNGRFYSYNFLQKRWFPGLSFTYHGPLVTINNLKVFSGSLGVVGKVRIFFALDMIQDLMISNDSVVHDNAAVIFE